jgi:RimJ/RimL family protein N-acetyltransferase
MTARIVAATLRDLSYVASRLRPEDEREVACQFEQWSPAYLAHVSLKDHAYVVEVNGNPEAAFGACSTTHKGLWVAWSWGTRSMWRAVPRITRFVREVMIPDIVAQGAHRCEARAMAEHVSAHRWLKRMGATERCDLPGWGKNGETFKLFEWLRS